MKEIRVENTIYITTSNFVHKVEEKPISEDNPRNATVPATEITCPVKRDETTHIYQ